MNLMQMGEVLASFGYGTQVFGIPVYISFWTVAMAVLLTMSAHSYIHRQLYSLRRKLNCSTSALVTGSLVGAVLMVISIAAHEIGHAITAYYFNYQITGAGISWWGAYVSLPDAYVQGRPLAMIAVSLAGPFTNFAISLIAMGVVSLLDESVTENTIQFVAYMNYRLGKLNILPIFVLDGGKVVWGLARAVFGNGDTAFDFALAVSFVCIAFFMGKRRKLKNYDAPRDRFEEALERL
ncbi:MAG: M50 family metallopeptidase [Candidatus Doudnabacteria bacterium]|nr:M50 family metallopeptidase [Candidatus Doudnabacteria bacterium]